MALSSIIKLALPYLQRELVKKINVVDNKADIIFTRLDNHLSAIKKSLPTTLVAGFKGENPTKIQHVVMPVVPSDLPQLQFGFNHEEATTLQGDIAIMGTPTLTKLTLDDYLLPGEPTKYPFSRPYGSNAQSVLEFLVEAQREFVPLRIIIVYHDGRVYLNLPCLVESISYHRDGVDDMRMTVNLIEYVQLDKGGITHKGVRLSGN